MDLKLGSDRTGRSDLGNREPSIIPVFKTIKTGNFKFSVNLSNCGQTARFSKPDMGLTVPKKSQNKHCSK